MHEGASKSATSTKSKTSKSKRNKGDKLKQTDKASKSIPFPSTN